MAHKIKLEVVSPEKTVFSDDVNMVIARSTGGEIGILPNHLPLLAPLYKAWPIRIKLENGEEIKVASCGGFMEVGLNRVTLLSDCAELPGEIDFERAERAKERAEKRLQDHRADIDLYRAEQALKRALMRIEVSGDK